MLTGVSIGTSMEKPSNPLEIGREKKAARQADLILLDGKFWTGEPLAEGAEGSASAQSVAIAGGRILFVGSNDAALALKGPATKVVRLGGRRVVPGFIDSHVHFIAGGFQFLAVDL